MSALHSQEYELRIQARTAFTREFSESSLMGSTERITTNDNNENDNNSNNNIAKTMTIVAAPLECEVTVVEQPRMCELAQGRGRVLGNIV